MRNNIATSQMVEIKSMILFIVILFAGMLAGFVHLSSEKPEDVFGNKIQTVSDFEAQRDALAEMILTRDRIIEFQSKTIKSLQNSLQKNLRLIEEQRNVIVVLEREP